MRSNVRIKHVTKKPMDIEEGQRMTARSETGRRIRSGRCADNAKEGGAGIWRLDSQNVQVVSNVLETTGTMDTRLDVRWW
jgi:hypothetical protein